MGVFFLKGCEIMTDNIYINILVEYLIVLVILFIFNYIFFIRKNKKYNKNNILTNVNLVRFKNNKK